MIGIAVIETITVKKRMKPVMGNSHIDSNETDNANAITKITLVIVVPTAILMPSSTSTKLYKILVVTPVMIIMIVSGIAAGGERRGRRLHRVAYNGMAGAANPSKKP